MGTIEPFFKKIGIFISYRFLGEDKKLKNIGLIRADKIINCGSTSLLLAGSTSTVLKFFLP